MAPSYTLDLTGYKERLSATVPEGRYLAQIDDVELTKTTSTNKDMFNVWVRIIDGPHAGAVLIDRLTITDKALFRIVAFLNGLGLPTPKKRLSLNTQQWMGRKVWIDTKHGEPYRGRPGRSEIDGYVRYVPETAEQDATVEVDESYSEMDRSNEPVKAFETDGPVPLEEAVAASQGDEATPAEDDSPATPSPFKAQDEPEMLSLSDISL